MKRKKKKKVNNQHARQSQRAGFNHFCRQLHHYLKLIECEDVAELFDKETSLALYEMRTTYLPKLRIARGVVFSTKTKKLLNSEFDSLISEKKIEFNGHISFSAKEIVQYLALIELFVRYKEDKPFDLNKTRLIQLYNEKMTDFGELHKKAIYEIVRIVQYLSIHMTRMNASICLLKYLHKPEGDEDRKMVFELNEYIPKKQTMIIDGHARPVYPISLAFSNSGPKELSIPAWRIRLPKHYDKPLDKTEFPVFFQNHLLRRLQERLDCFDLHLSQLWLYNSMEDPKFIYYKGLRLVEYVAEDNIKLGYIVLEFHKDRLLAKTFLLLTNAGTPEGDKLKELSGLEKCDHKYWAIDRLSTFYNSDLKDHPKTRTLFEQAGCGNLFKKISVLGMNSVMPTGTQANQILRYLEGAKEQEEMQIAV